MMKYQYIVALCASLVVGMAFSTGGDVPFTSLTAETHALADSSVTSGVIGQDCHWSLTDNGTVLTLDGGTLPEETKSISDSESPICEAIEKQGGVVWQITKVVLKGNVKAGVNADRLFSNMMYVKSIDGLNNLDTSNTTSMANMFSYLSNIKNLDLSSITTANVTDMSQMFMSDNKLGDLDLSKFVTSHVTNMAGMFMGYNSFTKLDVSKFDTSNVTDMHNMFAYSSNTEINVSNFDTSKVKNMAGMFRDMTVKKIDITNFDTGNVKSMEEMFASCPQLSEIKFDNKKFNTHQVTDMGEMFSGDPMLTRLDVSALDTSQVVYFNSMFSGDSGLKKLDVSHFDTSSAQNMHDMFSGDSGLTSLDVSRFKTASVTDMSGMLSGETALSKIDVSHFDTQRVRNDPDDKNDMGMGLTNMFDGDVNLTSLDLSHFSIGQKPKAYTYTGYMLYILPLNPGNGKFSLKKLVLGPDIQFEPEDLNGMGADPMLPKIIADSTKYTGKWQAVGTGTDANPKGKVYTSAELTALYSTEQHPKITETYVWQPTDANQPVEPVDPEIPINSVQPVEPETPTQPVFIGSSINSFKKIGLYRTPDFTAVSRRAWYAQAPRTRQPQFVVTGIEKTKNGTKRYRVRDVNHQSKTYRLTGYVTANSRYVGLTYYASTATPKAMTVLNPRGINGYQTKQLVGLKQHYQQGQCLKVKAVVSHNLTTRFQLENGQYVTANKQLVQIGKLRMPKQVTTKHRINRYKDVNFQHRKGSIAGHRTLRVLGWDYSNHGTVRYRVSGGYVTANRQFVR